MPQHLTKVMLFGDAGAGKTTLFESLVHEVSKKTYQPTINPQIARKTLEADGFVQQIQIWDTAGLEMYHHITRFYAAQADIAIILYDESDPDSFNSVPFWLSMIRTASKKEVKILLIGNKKSDLPNILPPEQGEKYATMEGIDFFEVDVHDSNTIASELSKHLKRSAVIIPPITVPPPHLDASA